jgi:hypothetical protein
MGYWQKAGWWRRLAAACLSAAGCLCFAATLATASATGTPAADVAKLNSLRAEIGVQPVALSAFLTNRCQSAIRSALNNGAIPAGFDVDQVSWTDLLNPAADDASLSAGERLDELLNPALTTIGISEATKPGAPGITAPAPMTCWTPTLGLTGSPTTAPSIYTFPANGQRFPGWELGRPPLLTPTAPELIVYEDGGKGSIQSFTLTGLDGPIPVTVDTQSSDRFLVTQSWLVSPRGETPLRNGRYNATATFSDGVTHTWTFTSYGVVDRPQLSIDAYDGQMEISSLSGSGIVTVTVNNEAGRLVASKRAAPTKKSRVTRWKVPVIRRGGRFVICAVVAPHAVYAGSRLCKHLAYAASSAFALGVSLGPTTSNAAQVILHARPPVLGQIAKVTVATHYVFLGTDTTIWHHTNRFSVPLLSSQAFQVPFQRTSRTGDIWEADINVTIPAFHAGGASYAATNYHGTLASKLP